MRLILLILFKPTDAVHQIRSNPRWLVAFLLLSATSVASYTMVHPYLVQTTLAHLPSSATNQDKHIVAESLNMELPSKLAFLPVRMFIGWSAFALALLYVCRSFAPRDPTRFRQMFSLVVHAEVISIVASLAALSVTVISPTARPMDIPLSLAGVIGDSQSFIIKSLLTSLNIFTLWHVVILTLGVSSLCGFGNLRSFLIVLLVWTLSILFNLGALKLLQDQLHLLL